MHALTFFRVYEENGEWFDLSKKPIERALFTFGGLTAIGWIIDHGILHWLWKLYYGMPAELH